MVNVMNQTDFDNIISNGVTVVDFFATWCGPCKMLAPVLEDLSTDLEGKVNFYKADVDVLKELSAKFNIMSVPTVLIFKDGEKKKAMVGYKPKEEILAELNKYL